MLAKERFLLPEGIAVRGHRDRGGRSFVRTLTRRGVDADRLPVQPRRGWVRTLDKVRRRVRTIVLHQDDTRDCATTFRQLSLRKPTPLATHFCIDWDGTIHQWADVRDRAAHATGVNDVSIGIDLNGRNVNLRGPGTAERHADAMAHAGRNGYRRNGPVVASIHGTVIEAYGFTDAQYRSLSALLTVLTEALGIERSGRGRCVWLRGTAPRCGTTPSVHLRPTGPVARRATVAESGSRGNSASCSRSSPWRPAARRQSHPTTSTSPETA